MNSTAARIHAELDADTATVAEVQAAMDSIVSKSEPDATDRELTDLELVVAEVMDELVTAQVFPNGLVG